MRRASTVPSLRDEPSRCELTVYVSQRTTTFDLVPGSRMVIGRSRKADILIGDPTVSRTHAVITVEAREIHIEDLGSNNGTELLRGGNGKPLTLRVGCPVKVSVGDVLRFGAVPCMVQPAQEVRRTTMGEGLTVPPPSREDSFVIAPAMKSLYELAGRAAQSDISVLVTGETGVGKEHVAAEIHRRSNRSAGPFVQINCAALSESLLESELFGHERGAFTGATGRREGVFESSGGGTLFLDEIGEMPLSIQAKLLRVLEERSIRRLGSTRQLPIDVRFVTATNRNLRDEVRRGRFREDLYFRISGLVLSVPPLRERSPEIEPLARHFLERFCLELGLCLPPISEDGVRALREYPWPGNVRQLKNAMERAPLLSGGAPITREHLPSLEESSLGGIPLEGHITAITAAPDRGRPFSRMESDTAPLRRLLSGLREAVPPDAAFDSEPSPISTSVVSLRLSHGNSRHYSAEEDKERILAALEACAGNQTRAAKLLGVSRRTLINRIEGLGMPRPRKPD